jgi:hypothetical protein
VARVIVTTDDGRPVASFNVPVVYLGNRLWANMLGRYERPLGWLGRALSDADIIQAGGDPERPSEKAMRLVAEQEAEPTCEKCGHVEDAHGGPPGGCEVQVDRYGHDCGCLEFAGGQA